MLNGGGGGEYVFLHAEEDIDARLDWAGCWGIRFEVRNGLTSDNILLVVQGEENMCSVLEFFNWGVGWEELVPDK